MQLDLFPQATAPSSSLAGLQIYLASPCGDCGSTVVVLGASKAMHEGKIKCECGTFRGWISKLDAENLRREIGRLGKRPATPLKI